MPWSQTVCAVETTEAADVETVRDHDGEISASEIRGAPAALLTLDKNGDGELTEDELLPGLAQCSACLKI